MANVFKRFVKGILLRGNTVDPTDNQEGSMWLNSTSSRIKSYVEAAVRTVATTDQSQILTNKTIDGDDNTVQDLSLTSLKTDLPNASKFIERDSLGNAVSGKNVPGGDVLGTTDIQTMTNKTIDATAATGTNTFSGDASDITFDNSTSGLTATDSQAALDEVEGRLDTAEAGKIDGPGTHVDNAIPRFNGVNTNDVQTSGLIIDDLDNVTGVNDLIVGGNLTVNGTTTTINSATLDVTDSNITVNNGGNDVSSEGAGLTVDRTGTQGSLVYEDALSSKFKLGALGIESEVVDVDSTQTITNKNMASATNNIDTASADSLTRNTGNQQVVTIPDTVGADNLVLEAFTQPITNKDIDGGIASNTNRITIPKNTSTNLSGLTNKEASLAYDTVLNKVVVNDGASWTTVGGDGVGGINYIKNSDMEIGTTHWSTYDDTNSVPVDGTGGTATGVSISTITTTADVVRGKQSLGISKSATNSQGEGVSTDTNLVDNADLGDRLQVYFNYKMIGAAPANYADGDVKVYVYDIDNLTMIGAVENDDNGDLLFSSKGTFIGFFNSVSNSNNYRLIFHNVTTNALAWDMSVDNVQLGPVGFVPVTREQQVTIDLTGSGVFTGGTFQLSRTGGVVSIKSNNVATFSSSTVAVSAVGIIPAWARPSSGLPINLSSYDGAVVQEVYVAADGTFTLQYRNWSGTLTAQTTSSNYSLSYSVDNMSNVVSNTELTQTTVMARYKSSSGQSITNVVSVVDYETLDYDTHNIVTTGPGWNAKIPRTGYYNIRAQMLPGTAGVDSLFDAFIFVNGTGEIQSDALINSNGSRVVEVQALLYLQKDDLIDIRASHNLTTNLNAGAFRTIVEISSVPDFTSYGVVNPNTEYIEAEVTTNVKTVSANVYVDSGAEITLTPGTWEIGYNASLWMNNISSGGNVAANAAIRDSANNVLPSTAQLTAMTMGSTSGVGSYASVVSAKTEIVITSTTTYKLSCRCSVANTLDTAELLAPNFTGLLTDPDTSSILWARRIS